VPAVAADLPWGRRELSHRQCEKLYPALLKQAARVLRPGTGRAVIVTAETRMMERLLAASGAGWGLQVEQQREIVLGYRAKVYVLRRALGSRAAWLAR
jgi:tRNA (guanine6-N2)-methyltransferase